MDRRGVLRVLIKETINLYKISACLDSVADSDAAAFNYYEGWAKNGTMIFWKKIKYIPGDEGHSAIIDIGGWWDLTDAGHPGGEKHKVSQSISTLENATECLLPSLEGWGITSEQLRRIQDRRQSTQHKWQSILWEYRVLKGAYLQQACHWFDCSSDRWTSYHARLASWCQVWHWR